LDGEEDFAFGAAYEIEAALLLDELELRGHAVDSRQLKVNSQWPKSRSLGFARDDNLFELSDGPGTSITQICPRRSAAAT